MSNSPIELKGSNFTLSVIHLHNGIPEIVHQALADKIAQVPTFLQQAPVVVNVSNLTAPVNWKHLQQAIIDTGLRIIGVSGCKDPKLKAEIERTGLPILSEGKRIISYSIKKEIEKSLSVIQAATKITKTMLIDKPVRSGQRIYASNCDLIITSHVSFGAELIADGNIHVYGALRGRVLAGANDNKEAQIFCTNLMAELVSIAGEYLLSDQIPTGFYGKAARLRLIDNILTVQPLI